MENIKEEVYFENENWWDEREMRDGDWSKMKKGGKNGRENIWDGIDDSIINILREIYDKISPWNLTPFLLSYF